MRVSFAYLRPRSLITLCWPVMRWSVGSTVLFMAFVQTSYAENYYQTFDTKAAAHAACSADEADQATHCPPGRALCTDNRCFGAYLDDDRYHVCPSGGLYSQS